jgi:quinol monooxygenase YgiN
MPRDIAYSLLKSGGPHYRIDKFIVPEAGLNDFLKQVEQVDAALSALPGCLQHLVMIQESHPGEPDIHVLTLVEWASAAHMDAAKACLLNGT